MKTSYVSFHQGLVTKALRLIPLLLTGWLAFTGTVQAQIIGDFVWNDLNTNGVQDVGEPGLGSVIVRLYDAATNSLGSTATDTNGFYAFTNQAPGDYIVGFIPPLGFSFTTNNAGTDDNLDSDANDFGLSPVFTFSGTSVTNIDAGFFQLFPGIQITKLANNAPDGTDLYVTNGTTVTYTYTVTNFGNTFFVPVIVDDDIIGPIGELLPPDIMPPGGTLVFTSEVVITESVTNIGLVIGFPADFKGNPLPGLDPAFDDDDAVVLIAVPGYTLTKTLLSPLGRAAAVGEAIQFQIDVVNTGDVALATLPVVDLFDNTLLAYTSAVPPADSVVGGTLTWNDLGALPRNAATSIVVNFTAIGSTLSLLETNTVVASPTTPPGVVPVPPQTNEAPYEISDPDFTIIKSVVSPLGRAAAVGENIVFNIVVTNTGDVTLTTVPVVDTYDNTVLSYVSASPASDDNVDDGVINWADIGPIPVGGAASIQATFTAIASTVDGRETNVVVSSPTTPPDEPPVPPKTNDVPYDVRAPGYTLAKTWTSPSGRAAQVGETLTFQLTLVNTGDVPLVTVPLVDTFDTAFLTYQSATPPADFVGTGSSVWNNIGPLPVGATTSVVVNFLGISSTSGFPETNVVVATPTTPPDAPPVPPQTNETPYEISSAGFDVVKTLITPSGRAAQVGENLVFTLTVINTGDVTLVTVPLEDLYDTTYLAYGSSEPASDDNVNDGLINWANIGPIPVGLSATVTSTFTAVASTVGNAETNTVIARPTTPPDEPPVPPKTNDTPYEISSPGFTVTKAILSPSGRAAQVGETLVFTLTVANTGDVQLVTVPVEDRYDLTTLAYQSAEPASDDNTNDGVINWADVGPLSIGGSVTITARYTAVASTGTGLETNIVVASPTTPPDEPPVPPKTNEVPYDISAPGFTVAKSLTSPAGRAAQVGEAVVFTLSVVNTGDVDLVTVPVQDQFEAAFLAYVSAVPPADSAAAGLLDWNDVGPLPIGSSTSIVVTFTAVASSGSEARTNTVVASPTTPPTEPPVPPKTNETPYEISAPGYDLVKTLVSPTGRSAIVGEPVVFQLTVINTGDVALVTVPLVDTFDATYLAFTTATPPADASAPGSITWNDVGPLPVGASTSVLVTLEALVPTPNAQTNTVVASPTTPPDEPPVPPKTNDVPYGIALYTIGDTVWLDLNGNGLPDEDLTVYGLNSVSVNLFVITNGVTNFVSSDVTANLGPQRGYYLFENLPFGDYVVEVVYSTLPTGAPTNGPNGGQFLVLVPTTPLRIFATVPTGTNTFLDADFGFLPADPTSVELASFTATANEDGSVDLDWETVTELNNMGFHLDRSDRPDGQRVRVTPSLIPGRGTGEGGHYGFTDTSLPGEGTYYYWLVDVEYDRSTREHGPVRVAVGDAVAAPSLGTTLLTGPGLYRITPATLTASGINPATVNPQALRVTLNGTEVAAFSSAYGSMLQGYDYLLVYVDAADGETVSLGLTESGDGDPLRMPIRFGFLDYNDGAEAVVSVPEGAGQVRYAADPAAVRTLVTGFADSTVWVLDITDLIRPAVLIGADVMYLQGAAAVYYSYAQPGAAAMAAVGASAIIDVPSLDTEP